MGLSYHKLVGAGVLALTAAAAVAAPTLGRNLLKNAGAEAGDGAIDRTSIVQPDRWTIDGNATSVVYGVPGMPNASTPGPSKRGNNFFAGGPNSELSIMEQRINVKVLADQINTGNIGYSLVGYLGGRTTDDDYVLVTISFADSEGTVLETASLPVVLASDRNNLTSLVRRSKRALVPISTQFINVTLTFTRVASTYNDGYADSLSLVLSEAQ